MPICLNVNGEDRIFSGDPMTPLLDVLRDDLFLTGAKAVCREGFCGACTVRIDGIPTMSCLRPVALLEDRQIVTIEGLNIDGGFNALQQAFLTHDVVQCGMCFPGMVISLTSFFERNPNATRAEVKDALVGNVCRCTGYERVIDAALSLQGQNEAAE